MSPEGEVPSSNLGMVNLFMNSFWTCGSRLVDLGVVHHVSYFCLFSESYEGVEPRTKEQQYITIYPFEHARKGHVVQSVERVGKPTGITDARFRVRISAWSITFFWKYSGPACFGAWHCRL